MFHIVDDEPFIRELVEDIFKSLGVDAISFESAEAYLAYIKTSSYQTPFATFTDINMPNMTGYDLMDEVYKTSSSHPFIIMSSETDVHIGYIEAAKGYLKKPFKIIDIQRIIAPLMVANHVSQQTL
jgi:FixJ family two-component response regulator